MPKKICNYTNCKRIISYKERYCDEHKAIKDKQREEYFKRYDRVRKEEKETKFYNSTAWEKIRKAALVRDYGLCQRCIASGVTKIADMVHHIVPIRQEWNKRLSLDNLQCLCDSCHRQVHSDMEKG